MRHAQLPQANNRNGLRFENVSGINDADELGSIAANLREQQNDFVVHPEQFGVFHILRP